MRHLLGIDNMTHTKAIQILNTAETMTATQPRTIKELPVLRGRTVATTFFEDLIRTRLSFGAATKRLSADVISFSAKGSSLSEGKSLKDTAQTIVTMGAKALIVRCSASDAPHRLARCGWINVPIPNGGDGTHQHLTQVLLDSLTLRRHLHTGQDKTAPEGSDLVGAYVVVVGDILHSRVARSNVDLLSLLGAKVALVAPPTPLPVGMEDWPCGVSYTLNDVLVSKPEAVMMLRVQRERMSGVGGGFFFSSEEYSRRYGLNAERFSVLGDDAVLMHPGPVNRGLEISANATNSAHSVVLEQVANGVSVRMAALYLFLAHGEEISA